MADLELYRPRQGRWQRFLDSLRSINLGPWNPKDPAIAKYFGGGSTLAGVSVNEETAMTVSAVWSAVTMVSDDIASLPLFLYKKLDGGGKARFENHPLYELLHDEPNPEMDSLVFRRTLQAHVMLGQNAYAEIERDTLGRPIALWPLVPENVHPFRERGQLLYRVHVDSGRDVIIPRQDMFHLVGYSHDGSVGCSLVNKARESLGLTLASEKFGAAFYGNGASMGGVVSVPGPRPDPKTQKGHQDQLEARHQGVERAHKLLVLYNDAKFTANVIPPNAGQFNETRIHQIREVARWFKIPPHKLGDLADATYSNVEQMDAVYLSTCIRPWLKLWEQQLRRKLVSRLERQQQAIEHDTHGFLSVDATSRAQLYSVEANIGTVTINEIRGYENRNPLPQGDRVFVPLNRIPLDRYDEWLDADLAEKKAKAEKLKEPTPAPVAPPARSVEQDKEIADLKTELALARRKAQEYEDIADKAKQDQIGVRAELTRETEAHQLTEMAAQSVREQRDALAGEVAGVRSELAMMLETLARRTQELDAAIGRADAAEQEADKWETEWQKEAFALTTEREARIAAEADQQKVHAELGYALTLKAEAERAAIELGEELNRGLDAVKAELTTERDARQAEQQARVEAEAERGAARDAAEKWRGEAEATAGEVVTAREMNAAIQQTLDELRQAHAKVTASEHSARTERDMLSQDIDTLQSQIAEKDRRLGDLIPAVRSVLAESMGRMVRREVAKAKNYHATPSKLRTWVETFYDATEEAIFIESLLPGVRLHLALMGWAQEPEAVAQEWVRQHFSESRERLIRIVDAGPEGFMEMFQRTIQRWEADRAERFADRVIQQEIADGR